MLKMKMFKSFLACAMYQLANDIAKVPRTHDGLKLRGLKNMSRD
jgi:hypothetical protein